MNVNDRIEMLMTCSASFPLFAFISPWPHLRLRVCDALLPLPNRLDMQNNQLSELNSLRGLAGNQALTAVDFKGNSISKSVPKQPCGLMCVPASSCCCGTNPFLMLVVIVVVLSGVFFWC